MPTRTVRIRVSRQRSLIAAGLLALPLVLPGIQSQTTATPPQLPAELFAYDARSPLEVETKVLERRSDLTISDISYASPKGGRVTGFLVAPVGNGPFAGILFGHWGGGNRTEFLAEAILLARAGAVSLLIDYPWTRPTPWRRALKYVNDPENDFPIYVQAVVDLRRGLDLLAARPDVDPTRLGYVGHSYGAQWGAILAAIDRRPKTVILAGGVPDMAALLLESENPDFVELRTTAMPRVQKLLDVMAPLSAIRYVAHAAPTPLFFQFARYEQNFKEAAMRRYYAAASEPKRISWYPTGHDLNDPQAVLDRGAWLHRYLGVRQIVLRKPAEPGTR